MLLRSRSEQVHLKNWKIRVFFKVLSKFLTFLEIIFSEHRCWLGIRQGTAQKCQSRKEALKQKNEKKIKIRKKTFSILNINQCSCFLNFRKEPIKRINVLCIKTSLVEIMDKNRLICRLLTRWRILFVKLWKIFKIFDSLKKMKIKRN
jgi:hypothetical protein